MGINKANTADAVSELRQRAEEQLHARASERSAPRTTEETERLVHELEVRQIELELQNAELRQTRYEVDSALKKYADLYDNSPVSYFTLNRSGIIRAMNLTAINLFKVERSKLIGRSFEHLVAITDRPVFNDFLQKVSTSKNKEVCEVALQKKGRHQFIVKIKAVPAASREEFQLALIDVSKRKWTEYLLLRCEKQLAEAQSIAHIGSWKLESITFALTGSNEFFRIFGHVITSYKDFLKLVHPDDRDKVHTAIQNTFDTQEAYAIYYRIIRPDGSIRLIQGHGEAIADEAGTVDLMIGTIQDVTERSRHDEHIAGLRAEIANNTSELADAYYELEAFKFTVSNDLRAVLSDITTCCKDFAAINHGTFNEPACEFTRNIDESANQLNALIETMLAFSSLAHTEMQREIVDLSALSKTVTDQLQETTPDCRVISRIAEGVRVTGDSGLLLLVQSYLLGNAWKYAANREGAAVEFGELYKNGEQVYFVSDNGPGLDLALVGKLFVPFPYMSGSGGARTHGIALATVERIINYHGGKLWAEQDPVKGACYYYTLSTGHAAC